MKTKTPRVILDTNLLLVPSQFKLDVFEELSSLLGQRFDPVILSSTYKELLRIFKNGSPKMRQQASLALRLAEKCQMIHIKKGTVETPDDIIVRFAKKWGGLVATNDRALKKRLRNINIPVIYLRQKSRLEIEGCKP